MCHFGLTQQAARWGRLLKFRPRSSSTLIIRPATSQTAAYNLADNSWRGGHSFSEKFQSGLELKVGVFGVGVLGRTTTSARNTHGNQR